MHPDSPTSAQTTTTAIQGELAAMRRLLLEAVGRVDTLAAHLAALDGSGNGARGKKTPLADPDRPQIIPSEFAVEQFGRRCRLGNRLGFRVLTKLLERPGSNVSRAALAEELWERIVTTTAVETMVSRLRKRLREAGLGRLADSIDGQEPGCYRIDPTRWQASAEPENVCEK
jgi:DNA-binding response OmpR family regulator